jgi:hypothetical protein
MSISLKSARRVSWTSDRIARAIFAAGIVGMLGVFWGAEVFADYGDTINEIMKRRARFAGMFVTTAAFAVSGPLAACIVQAFPSRAGRPFRKKPKAIGLEDL